MMYQDLESTGCSYARAAEGAASAEDLGALDVAVGGLIGYVIGLGVTHFTQVDEKLAYVCDVDARDAQYAVELGLAGVGALGCALR